MGDVQLHMFQLVLVGMLQKGIATCFPHLHACKLGKKNSFLGDSGGVHTRLYRTSNENYYNGESNGK